MTLLKAKIWLSSLLKLMKNENLFYRARADNTAILFIGEIVNRKKFDKIMERSKTKSDGVYSCGGISYYVKNNHPVLFVDYRDVIQFSYGFLVKLGTIENYWDAKKHLKKLAEKL